MMNVGLVVLTVGGSVGMLCSILTLYIIHCLDKMNGYMILVTLLTISQLLYDASIIMVVLPGDSIMEFIYIAVRSMSGLWATLITNVLSSVIVYTAWTLKAYDIMGNLPLIVAVIFVPSTLCGVLVSVTLFSRSGEDSTSFIIVSNIYYWIRIMSIIFNITCYFLLRRKLSMIRRKSPTTMQLRPAIDTPLHALAARFKYYPIIQVLSRLGVSLYEFNYGHEYKFDEGSSLRQKIALFWYVLTLPSAGLGFFIVFLVVTPGATWYLRAKVLGFCCRNNATDGDYRYRQRSRLYVGHSANYGYDVMTRRNIDDSSDFTLSNVSQYAEWSEEDLSDEVSSCMSRTSEGEYVMNLDSDQNNFISFYDDEKNLLLDENLTVSTLTTVNTSKT